MPTRIEAYVPSVKKWVKVDIINPGALDRSLPNRQGKEARLVIFSCLPDDSGSIVRRSKVAYPAGITDLKESTPDPSEYRIAKKLNAGESVVYNLQTEPGKTRRIRITHYPKNTTGSE